MMLMFDRFLWFIAVQFQTLFGPANPRPPFSRRSLRKHKAPRVSTGSMITEIPSYRQIATEGIKV